MVGFPNDLITGFPSDRGIHMELFLDLRDVEVSGHAYIISATASRSEPCLPHDRVVLLEEGRVPVSSSLGVDGVWGVADADSGIRIHILDTLNKIYRLPCRPFGCP